MLKVKSLMVLLGSRKRVACPECGQDCGEGAGLAQHGRAKHQWVAPPPHEKIKRNHLWSRYGIRLEQYEAMVVAQDGRCAICGSALEQLHVDHDHETGEIRGLLCSNCNVAISQLGDDVETMESAIAYLEAAA
jgi:DNA-directed RNA polymerase subunit RPC12/RpoP